jgi:hypothetical protein
VIFGVWGLVSSCGTEIDTSVTFDDRPMTDDAMYLIYYSMNRNTRRAVRTVHIIATCDRM